MDRLPEGIPAAITTSILARCSRRALEQQLSMAALSAYGRAHLYATPICLSRRGHECGLPTDQRAIIVKPHVVSLRVQMDSADPVVDSVPHDEVCLAR